MHRLTSASLRRTRPLVLGLLILMSPISARYVSAWLKDVVGDKTTQVVEESQVGKGYVVGINQKYKAATPEYVESRGDADGFYQDPKMKPQEAPTGGRSAKENKAQEKGDLIEEIQIGDPPTRGQRGLAEVLTVDPETAALIEENVSGDSKAAKIDSKLLAMETLKLSKEYAQNLVSRKEPPSPTKVKEFLALYGLPFVYPNGQFVPYCASGVGFAAARAHYRLAWPKDHPGDPQNADPGDNHMQLRQALPDVTRDYCKTHPATRVMMQAAKLRKHSNGKPFWVTRNQRPKQAWLVFFNWTGGKMPQHVGIVDGINPSGTTLSTIEFNTSRDNPSNGGYVVPRTRNVRYVVGYIRTYPD